MKGRAVVVTAVAMLLLALGAADRLQEPHTAGVPAPPPQLGHVGRRRFPTECPEPFCPEPVCPVPVCPQPVCPTPPACPTPSCPQPMCPQPSCPPAHCPPCPGCPPANVTCPQPVCPTLPPVPPCPGLSCPEPVCLPAPCPPPPSSAPCPACPDCHPANVSCPRPVCPPAVCPQPVCPPPSCPSAQQACPVKGAACNGCLWKVLVTYDHFQGVGFYKAYKTKVDWHQAKALCAADGGHLAVINSDKEAELMKLLYQKNELSGWIFIGFHDLNEEKKYETVTGEPLSKTGYMKWRPGQPDNAGNEDCGTIDQNALLNDGRCGWKIGFICEVHEEKAFGQ